MSNKIDQKPLNPEDTLGGNKTNSGMNPLQQNIIPEGIPEPLPDVVLDDALYVNSCTPPNDNRSHAAFIAHDSSGVSLRSTPGAKRPDRRPRLNLTHALAAPQTTENDREFYELGLKVKKGDMQDLIGAWRQTTEGNCVTVGVTKAACDIYGSKLFKKIKNNDEGIQVKLQNGEDISLSWDELSLARKYSDFRGSNEAALAFGTLVYAVAAKGAQNVGHEGARSYSRALVSLNNGEYVKDVASFLGIEDKLQKVDTETLDDKDGIIAASNGHVIYVNRGADGKHYADSYGSSELYNETDTNGSYYGYGGLFRKRRYISSHAISSAYTLKPLDATGS